MSKQQKKPDRRSSKRAKTKPTLKVYCYRGSLGLGKNIALALVNISETGIRLLVDTQLAEGSEVEVHLKGQFGNPVKVQGKVVWCKRSADGIFRIGMRADKSIPYRYVEQFRMLENR